MPRTNYSKTLEKTETARLIINSVEEMLTVLLLRWIHTDVLIQRVTQRGCGAIVHLEEIADLRDLLDADAQEIRRLYHLLRILRTL